ncbi:GNAT family N-acetyltransferase [Paenibacillus apiarius]|uniref:GNAT family N-acetyltransferase n=2 Tax=Paenibacillus apiarius TaxID=46240 RepID=UPI00197FCF6A|nr:GNAT family N-acetyltransferase [Paenibacillus apiarius]MBN3526739.1 GNAT family N-acetyltransferase [Paenibacillus apiarius]
MSLVIQKMEIEEKDILKNLMQYYFYDFSEYVRCDVNECGQFDEYPYLDSYWGGEGKVPFYIQFEGNYIGFVLVRFVRSFDKDYYSIAEFFVMKKYRRSGLGRQAAIHIFDLFPGNWEVCQLESNKPAQDFWIDVIGQYTNNTYSDRIEHGKRIQQFVN